MCDALQSNLTYHETGLKRFEVNEIVDETGKQQEKNNGIKRILFLSHRIHYNLLCGHSITAYVQFS